MKLRIWAKENFVFAQFLIVILMITLYFVGSVFGTILFNSKAAFDTHYLLFISGLIFLGILIHHWLWRSGNLKYLSSIFQRIKNIEYIGVVFCFMLLGVHFGGDVHKSDFTENRSINLMINVLSFEPVLSVAKVESITGGRQEKVRKFVQKLQRKAAQGLNWVVGKFFKGEHISKKVLFVIFAGVIALLLFTLIAFLSCSLSCGGNPVLAVLALSLGILVIIMGIQLSSRAFIKRWNKEKGMEKGKLRKESWLMTLTTVAALVIGFGLYVLTIS